MAIKKLNQDQLKSLENMLIKGDKVSTIADLFKVSQSTINNHKAKLKKDGVAFLSKTHKINPVRKARKDQKIDRINITNTTKKLEDYYFLINGVKISVSSSAKKVHIGKNFMVVDY
jgi:transposase